MARRAERAARSVPSSRAFRLLWTGQSVSEAGTFVSVVALPLLAVTRLHASTFEVSAIEAVEWLPAVLIGLQAGALVDRSRRKRHIMIVASLGQAAALGIVPALAAAGVLTMTALLAAAFAAGVAGVFFQTAWQPFLRAIVPPGQLLAANGRLQASQSAAQVGGPALGGLLVQAAGAAGAVLADAASFVVGAATLALIRAPEPEPGAASPPGRPVRADIRDGLRYLAGDRLLSALAIVSAAANLLLTAIGAILVVFLVRAAGVPAAGIGVLLAAGGAGGLAGALGAGPVQRRLGTPLTARGVLAATAPFALLLPLAHRGAALILFAAGLFAASAGLVLASVTFASLRQAACPPGLLGRVSATSRLLTGITVPVGALAGGFLGQQLGTRAALLAAAVAYTLVGAAATASPLRRAPELLPAGDGPRDSRLPAT